MGDFPKIKKRYIKSQLMQGKLRDAIFRVIEDLEKENHYEYETAEIMNVFLDYMSLEFKRCIKDEFNS